MLDVAPGSSNSPGTAGSQPPGSSGAREQQSRGLSWPWGGLPGFAWVFSCLQRGEKRGQVQLCLCIGVLELAKRRLQASASLPGKRAAGIRPSKGVFWERDKMGFKTYIATSLCCDPAGLVTCQIRRENGPYPILEIAALGLGGEIILVLVPSAAAG